MRVTIEAALEQLRSTKRVAEQAFAQLGDGDFARELAPEANSIAIIVQHLAGNMISRWTDFLTTDGEKPGRSRDAEFEPASRSRAELIARWNEGWAAVFAALEPLTDEDLGRIVYIRGEAHTVARAIVRQVHHYGMHVGQIIYIAKCLRGDTWRTLSIPRAARRA